MSRLFFHFTNGSQIVQDATGLRLQTSRSDRDKMLQVLLELTAEEPWQDWTNWVLTVVDDRGRLIWSIPLAKLNVSDQSAPT
jgi:hypothetical protein